MHKLPAPTKDASEHSATLTAFIRKKIAEASGQIPFSEYMNLALYTPGLGYYTAGKKKFGREGDFVTAPEISPLFGQCVAKCIHYPVILEFGAGSGILAATLLQHCPDLQTYYILEVSADLRQCQYETINRLCPEYLKKVVWLDKLPDEKLTGVIIANEVIDAFPATRFCWKNKQVFEYFVTNENQQFHWHLDAPSDERITTFVKSLELSDNYSSEMHLYLHPWIKSVSDILEKGLVLLFDYGFPQHEFYHPDRSMGTLMCHYHHYAHDDPFLYPGLQDITAHVNFTAIAQAAFDNNLDIAGYTSQAAFLLDCGIAEMATDMSSKNQLKRLTHPNEMGELFKVIALTRDHETPVCGFGLQDRRNRL